MDDAMAERAPSGPECTFSLIGHGAAEAILSKAWSSGKLAHGWLLTGSEGIGKATLAFRFARAILSGAMDRAALPALPGMAGPERLPDVSPDDIAARRIAAGAHPGLKAVRRSINPRTDKLRNEIVVDDVRDAMRFLTKTSADGGWRIVIVDPVDEMNRNAANALLKSLEEPPDKCLFLLVNHVPGTILPTIRSRCQILAMSTLVQDDLLAAVRAAAPGLAARADDVLLGLADGSPGRAIRLLEADAGKLEGQIGAILTATEDASGIAALDLAEQVARAGATVAFRTVGQLLARRAAIVAREAPQSVLRDAAAALWFELGERFRQTELLNLDRRHTVLKACRDIRKLVPPAGAPGA